MRRHGKLALAAATLILVTQATSLEFDQQEETVVSAQKEFNLTFSDPEYENSSVYYFENGSKIGSSSEESEDFRLNYDSNVSDSFEVFNLTAVESNSTEFENSSREITLENDRSAPSVDGSSVEYTVYDNGTIDVYFEVDEEGVGMENVELFREFNGSNMTVGSAGAGESFNLTDRNSDNFYGGEFRYSIFLEDGAGNENIYVDDDTVEPEDSEKPILESLSPEDGDVINNKDDPSFEAELKDNLSGLKEVEISLGTKSESFNNLSTEKKSVSIDISNFDDTETFTADITVEDNAGNTASFSPSFTTDRTPPDVSGSVFPDREFIQSEISIGIDVSGKDVSDVEKVACFLEDEQLETDDKPNNNDIYSCGTINPENYADGEKVLYGNFFDSVGNSKKTEIGSWIFDTGKPEIVSAEITPKYGWKSPEVRLETSDEAAEISKVEYWFDVYDERETEDEIPELKSPEVVFEPEVDGFEDGEHTLNMRVQDRTGKWSDVEEINYFLFKDERPSPNTALEKIEIVSGKSKMVETELKNKGKVGLISATLNFTEILEGSIETDYLPRESSKEIEINATTNKGPGIYNTTLQITDTSKTREYQVKTVVKANERQQKEIEKEIEELRSRIKSVKRNYSELEKQDLGSKKLAETQEKISRTEKSLDRLENLSDSGSYYVVAEELPEAKNQSRAATNSVMQLENAVKTREIMIYAGIIAVPIIAFSGLLVARKEDLRVTEFLIEGIEKITNPIKSVFYTLVPTSAFESYYRDLRYSQTGTKLAVATYKVKRKMKKLFKDDGVRWKGYH